jgi:hypothetical protein
MALPWLVSLLLAAPASAAVIDTHLGVQLVEQPNRRTLIIDLCAPGVTLRATRYEEKKQTTQNWGSSLGLQAAVNGDFFDFPAATLVLGRAMGEWEWWPWGTAWIDEQSRPYWQMGPQWVELVEVGYDEPSWLTKDIVGAHNTLMSEGVVLAPWISDQPLLNTHHKRTAYGLSASRRRMFWTVVHSPITALELVEHMLSDAEEAGAPPPWWISNQDGGGSSGLWVDNQGFVMPSTRKVANHLGVFALGFGQSAFNCAQVPWQASYQDSTFPITVPGFGSLGTVQLKWGESVTGTMTFSNDGSSQWSPGITKLAPTPVDQAHPLASSDWLSPTRISTVNAPVAPGDSHAFALTLHGSTPGSHTLALNLVEEGVAWFFDETVAGGPPLGSLTIEVEVSSEPFCTPSCGGKQCGGDGCGGTCGSCPPPTACDGAQCACVPDCAGKSCGADGCGGTCGTCPGGSVCDANLCVCAPTCIGKSCGTDGCGGSCGTCPPGTTCNGDQCVCLPSCGGKQCGTNGCGGSCGACPPGSACEGAQCICAPNCEGKSCGDDGCGGSCGDCPDPDAGEESGEPPPEDIDVETQSDAETGDSPPDILDGEEAGEEPPDILDDAKMDVASPVDSTTDDSKEETGVARSSDTEGRRTQDGSEWGSDPVDVGSSNGTGFPRGSLQEPVAHGSSAQDKGCRQTPTTSPSLPAVLLLASLLLAVSRRRGTVARTRTVRILASVLCALPLGGCGSGGGDQQPDELPVIATSSPRWVIPSDGLPVTPLASNNNVEIAWHEDRLFLAWRTAPFHFASTQTRMEVISSTDEGATWDHECTFALGTDVREPRLLSFQGQLQLLFFEAGADPLAFSPRRIHRSFRTGDGSWTELEVLLDEPEVPWDIKVHQGAVWMTSYRGEHYGEDRFGNVEVLFKKSTDGIDWELVDGAPHVLLGGSSEVAFEFTAEGDLWAVTRNEDGDATGKGARVCHAKSAALSAWECTDPSDLERYDSPEMFRHGETIYLVARRDVGGPYGLDEDMFAYSGRPKRTALYRLDTEAWQVVHLFDLPGVGDTAFPSVVPKGDGVFLLANYTSPLDQPDISWLEAQLSPEGTQIYLLDICLGASSGLCSDGVFHEGLERHH